MSSEDNEQEAAYVEAGARLRALRQDKGLSQEALSLNAEIDQSTLSKVERLGPQVVGWRKLAQVAEALDCIIEVNFRPRK